MSATDLSRIDRFIEIAAPPEVVWRALTSEAGFASWFHVKVEGDIAPGSDVWMTTTHPEWAGQRFPVRFVEMTKPTRFVWTWHPGAVDPKVDYSKEARTTVTFTLDAIPAGTRLSVAETGFNEVSLARRAKVFGDNTKGWDQVLIWLQEYADSEV